MKPPPGKSGPLSVDTISCSGFFISAAAVSHTSDRLNEQILLAIDTAIPTLLFTSTAGNLVGSSTGSVIELS